MGRKSKLTEKQWAEVEHRLLHGESRRAVARDYGISEAAVREKLSARVEQTKAIANQIYTTNQLVKSLPMAQQISAQNLAEEMLAISTNLASAGRNGAIISSRIMQIAVEQSGRINRDDPMESADVLQGIAALTRISNDASTIGMNMAKLQAAASDQADAAEIVINRSYGHHKSTPS